MANIFKKQYNVNLPKSAHAESEFGPGKSGILMCSLCKAVYFKKHWHHNLEKLNAGEARGAFLHDTSIKFKRCPACEMIANKQYEGRIILKNVPEKSAAEVTGLIKGFCKRAYERDPMDRLIDLKRNNLEWEVTTTENELASKLASKIKQTFHNARVTKHFAAEPSKVVHVVVEFPK